MTRSDEIVKRQVSFENVERLVERLHARALTVVSSSASLATRYERYDVELGEVRVEVELRLRDERRETRLQQFVVLTLDCARSSSTSSLLLLLLLLMLMLLGP